MWLRGGYLFCDSGFCPVLFDDFNCPEGAEQAAEAAGSCQPEGDLITECAGICIEEMADDGVNKGIGSEPNPGNNADNSGVDVGGYACFIENGEINTAVYIERNTENHNDDGGRPNHAAFYGKQIQNNKADDDNGKAADQGFGGRTDLIGNDAAGGAADKLKTPGADGAEGGGKGGRGAEATGEIGGGVAEAVKYHHGEEYDAAGGPGDGHFQGCTEALSQGGLAGSGSQRFLFFLVVGNEKEQKNTEADVNGGVGEDYGAETGELGHGGVEKSNDTESDDCGANAAHPFKEAVKATLFVGIT